MSNPKSIAKPAALTHGAKVKLARQAASAPLAQSATSTGQTIVADEVHVYRVDPLARIAVIRQGIPASTVRIGGLGPPAGSLRDRA